MTDLAPRTCTVEEYLERDAAADDVRYEYDNGTLIPMAGAEPEHNQTVANVAAELSRHLAERGCYVLSALQRVRVASGYVYPDVVVACDPQYADTRPRTLLNPELLVEVTSESTSDRDVVDKVSFYTMLDSLHEYWIVKPDRPLLMQYIRDGDEWRVRHHTTLDATVHSPPFEATVRLRDLYRLVLNGDT
jgi:Uma2 family endonuclease